MDAREEVGHQNWGLAQQKKNKASNQQRQSDYTINYLGKSKGYQYPQYSSPSIKFFKFDGGFSIRRVHP